MRDINIYGRFAVHEFLILGAAVAIFASSHGMHCFVRFMETQDHTPWHIWAGYFAEDCLYGMGIAFLIMSSYLAIRDLLNSMNKRD